MSRTRRGGGRRAQDFDEHLDALKTSSPRASGNSWSAASKTLIGLALIVLVVGVVYLIYVTATGGDDAGSEKPAEMTVAEGDTLAVVADKLKEAGVVESATIFKFQARMEGDATLIKPGEYTFEPGTDSGEIIASLTANRPPPTFPLTVPEGLTIEQTARRISAQSGISQDAFEAAARETDYGYAFLDNPEIETLEGYLFPKKYEFEKGTNASQVVSRMLEQYLIETQKLDFARARDGTGLGEHELLTVASLIEREAANPEEKPLVAAVIYNRLERDMPLQIDATIQYARGEPKEKLSLEDLEIDSPYNTYTNAGLPPGPICSPSLDSVRAAVRPADTDYLYYVLKKDGKEHFFTNDYEEFLEAKEAAGH
ncbi:MAG: endolytic transglycosylase MltG [Rubrobacteraceae bacterium]